MPNTTNIIETELYKGLIKVRFNPATHRYYVSYSGGPFESKPGMSSLVGIIDKSQSLIPWAVGVAVDFLKENKELLESAEADEIFEQAEKESERKKQEAADIGTIIHEWIERDIKGLHPDMPIDDSVVNGVVAWLDWKEKHKAEILESERVVYSLELDYIGRLDFIAKIISCGKKCCGGHEKEKELIILGDIKTGNGVYATMGVQNAGYLKAYKEEMETEFDGRLILRLSKETKKEYEARIAKKNESRERKGKPPIVDPYKVFEPVWLDNDGWLEDDLKAVVAARELYRWKYPAEKRLAEAR